MKLEAAHPELKLLKRMQNDISFMKQKIIIMEEEVDAISGDMHEVRPEYIKRIREIEKKGRFRSFRSVDELKKAIEV